MIREKIFRLHRHKSSAGIDAFGEKIDFTFSKIQAFQVPKGWDKLCLSLISSETGKTVKKSGKGSVKNGTCQWMETISESIWISNLDSSKETEQHFFKFLVAMGSSRSGILGETALDLAAFLSSEKPILVSLPLKKCNYGTILEVEIRCLTPKTNLRDEKWKEMHARKDGGDDDDDIEKKSEVSDSMNTKSTDSCSNNKFGSASRPKELSSRETSFSSSYSRYSFDSLDDSVGRQSFSSQSNNLNGSSNAIGRQDSIETQDCPSYGSYSTLDSSTPDSKNQREECRKLSHASAHSSQQNAGSHERLKEADDATVEVLKAEAKMWERNARKLAIDVENLRKELSDQFMSKSNLNMELATSHSECQKLSQEIEHLKLLLEESTQKKSENEKFEHHGSTRDDIRKEFEDEMRFQKESNENFSLQLKKTQESNLELISILQEMEETIEKQRMEIENLLSSKLELMDTDSKNGYRNEDCREIYVDNQVFVGKLKGTGIDEQVPQDEKVKLELQEKFQSELLCLETTLQEKIIETEIDRDVKNLILKDFEMEYRCILASKQEEILNLEAALSRAQSVRVMKESDHVDSCKEIERLKEKVQELEADCNELTEENLELLFEIKELRKSDTKDSNTGFNCPSQEDLVNVSCHDSMSEVRKLEFHIQKPVVEIEKKEVFHETLSELEDESKNHELQMQSFTAKSCNLDVKVQKTHEKKVDSLEKSRLSELETENVYLSQRISGLEAQLRYLTDTKESSRLELQHLESQVSTLQNDIRILEEELELQKLDMKQKLSEMQERWSEAQEECASLSRVNVKLQATTENLVEECETLQKFNGELRQQKSTLQNEYIVLEAKVRNLEDSMVEGNSLDSKIDEGKHRGIIDELESKLKHSENERFRFSEENSILHMQLQKAPELQNEVLALRLSLKEMKSKTQFLDAAFNSVSGDYDVQKRENVSMVEKISNMQKVVSEVEECRNKKIALEEKILRLEGDLIAKDALYVLDVEMKNEVHRIKLENGQLHLKLKHVEDVSEDLHKKVQFLEEELKQTRCNKESQRESISKEEEEKDSLSNDKRSRGPEMHVVQPTASEKPEAKETIDTSKNESKISLLEAELQDIRERYLQISLKYAEVEIEREQLVMKLKGLNSWSIFSK